MRSTPVTRILMIIAVWLLSMVPARASVDEEIRVVLHSAGWELVGDLRLPDSPQPVPAVLLLNKAAGDRHVYRALADYLAQRGMASLRLDLRGHGESTNLGRFIPDEADSMDRKIMIWDSDVDVINAHRYLKTHARIDSNKIAMVGAIYSGEEMAKAARKSGHARAYVALSPGSFSDESILAMDSGSTPWFFIISRNERYLHDITANVQSRTQSVEMLFLPGTQHATKILEDRQDIAERIAIWLARQLSN